MKAMKEYTGMKKTKLSKGILIKEMNPNFAK